MYITCTGDNTKPNLLHGRGKIGRMIHLNKNHRTTNMCDKLTKHKNHVYLIYDYLIESKERETFNFDCHFLITNFILVYDCEYFTYFQNLVINPFILYPIKYFHQKPSHYFLSTKVN